MKSKYKNEIASVLGISLSTLAEELHSEPMFSTIQNLGYRMQHKRLYGAALQYVCNHYCISEKDFVKK